MTNIGVSSNNFGSGSQQSQKRYLSRFNEHEQACSFVLAHGSCKRFGSLFVFLSFSGVENIEVNKRRSGTSK